MKKYILLVSAAITLAACSNEDNYTDEPVAARISATIGDSAPARASDTRWNNGDNIGISMTGKYDNLRYTTPEGDGVFDGTTMYFNNKVDPVNISAYYPFTGTEGTANALIETSTVAERQTPSEQQKFDFMYAVKENVKGSDPNVNLTFAHRMSKLTLIFKNGNDGTDVSKITECVMSRLTLEGSFNPATGDCAAKTTSPAVDFTVSPTVEDDGTVFCSLLLFPQSVSKVAMRIRDSEQQDFLCDLNFGADGLVPGNHYQFTITVNKAMLSVSNSILPWNKSDLTSDASSDLSQVIKPTPETEQ